MTSPQTITNEELSFKDSGYLRLPLKIAERHLTQETENSKAEVQAIGTHVQILIRSEREDMLIRIPLKTWVASKAYKRSMSGWTVNLKKWKDEIENPNEIVKVKIHARQEF